MVRNHHLNKTQVYKNDEELPSEELPFMQSSSISIYIWIIKTRNHHLLNHEKSSYHIAHNAKQEKSLHYLARGTIPMRPMCKLIHLFQINNNAKRWKSLHHLVWEIISTRSMCKWILLFQIIHYMHQSVHVVLRTHSIQPTNTKAPHMIRSRNFLTHLSIESNTKAFYPDHHRSSRGILLLIWNLWQLIIGMI